MTQQAIDSNYQKAVNRLFKLIEDVDEQINRAQQCKDAMAERQYRYLRADYLKQLSDLLPYLPTGVSLSILKPEISDPDTELSYAERSIIDALGHTSLTDSQADELKTIIQEWLHDLMAKGEMKGFELGVADPLADSDLDIMIGGSPAPTAKDFALISYGIQYRKTNGRFPPAQEYQMAETICSYMWAFLAERLHFTSRI